MTSLIEARAWEKVNRLSRIGLAPAHTIWLDDNAAGWGWFVDATPGDDSEFTMPGNQGEQRRMDLLMVIAHKIGHLLRLEHAADGVMIDTLATGLRHLPGMQGHVLDAAIFEWAPAKKK